MLVEIKHDAIYFNGEKLKTGIVDISEEAFESLSKRGLVKKIDVEVEKQEEKPKRGRRKKVVEETKE